MRFAFSTESIEPEGRFESFRDALVRRLFQLDLVDRSGVPYRGEVDLCVGGPVIFGRVHGAPAEFFRSPALARRCEEGVWALLTRSGRMRVDQADVQRDLLPGEGIVFDAVRPHTGQCVVESDTWVVQVPNRLLQTLRPRAADNAPTLLAGGSALTQMMLGMLEAHHRLGNTAPPELGLATAQYLADLVALALGTDADGSALAAERGLKAGRLQAVLDDIAEHFSDARLSPADVALRLGITPRYVHLLLEETGRTFSEHVLEHRLQLARRLMLGPFGNARRIAEIAYACGFNDLSYFNRKFRQRFGETPSDVRAQANGQHEPE